MFPFICTYICTCCQRRQWQPAPVPLPGKSHGWRSLAGCSPRGRYKLDTTEWLHFHFSLSCIGGGNGNPLQCSYLENPRDGGAWWAAVYGVAQSQTWLKWLSSSSSISKYGLLYFSDKGFSLVFDEVAMTTSYPKFNSLHMEFATWEYTYLNKFYAWI